MGNSFFNNGVAAVPGVWRAGYGGGESVDVAGEEQPVCSFDWLCETDFSDYLGYCHSTVYGTDGSKDEERGLYLCGSGECPEKRSDNDHLHCNGGWSAALGHPDDCTGMELF